MNTRTIQCAMVAACFLSRSFSTVAPADEIDDAVNAVRKSAPGAQVYVDKKTGEVIGVHLPKASTAIIQRLEAFPQLQSLTIGEGATDEHLEIIAALSDLTTLDITHAPGWSNISDKGLCAIGRLKRLEHLGLSLAKIRGGGLESLKNLKHLQSLHLPGNPIEPGHLESLEHLPDLYQVVLAGTRIDNDDLMHVGNIKKLSVLDIGDTSIGDEGLKHLIYLCDLAALYIPNTKVTERGLEYIEAALPNTLVVAGDDEHTAERILELDKKGAWPRPDRDKMKSAR